MGLVVERLIMKELKSVAQKQFLERKGITYEQCTSRQKQILKTETPAMWEFYQWDLSDKIKDNESEEV